MGVEGVAATDAVGAGAVALLGAQDRPVQSTATPTRSTRPTLTPIAKFRFCMARLGLGLARDASSGATAPCPQERNQRREHPGARSTGGARHRASAASVVV